MIRARLSWVALALLIAVSGSGVACRRPRPIAHPNILLIVVDTLRSDVLGCYGGSADASPRIDMLARAGVRFSEARAQAPWTIPSMSSLLSGCHPAEHHQGVAFREFPQKCSNLAVSLAGVGYATGAVADVATPLLQQGFMAYEVPFGPYTERYRVGRANLARQTFEKAAAWVSDHRHAPFFLFVHTYEVHDYFLSKDYARRAARRTRPSYQGRFQKWALRDPSDDIGRQLFLDLAAANEDDLDFVRQMYLAQVRATDEAIGSLLDRLDEFHLREKTLVVFTSDHGEGFDREARRFSHGGRLHDDVLRVPLVVSWPGHLAPAVSARPVELVDVVPSLLAVAAVSGPGLQRGHALIGRRPAWQTWLGREPWGVTPAPGRWEGWAEECCFAVDAYGLREEKRAPQYALIAPPYKLVLAPDSSELYDLKADPGERRNLAATRPETRESLAGRLRTRLAAFGEGVAGSEDERLEALRSLGYVR